MVSRKFLCSLATGDLAPAAKKDFVAVRLGKILPDHPQ